MKWANLCNENGVTQCGSDGHVGLDGRWGMARIHNEVRQYRRRFEKNLSHKAENWTHFMVSQKITGEGKVWKI